MAYDSTNNFQNEVSATLGAGPYNDVGYAVLLASGATPSSSTYRSGSTNRVNITASGGNITINGFDASGCSDGFTMLIYNASASSGIIFNHLNSGSLANNQITCANGAFATLNAQTGARISRVNGKWTFA